MKKEIVILTKSSKYGNYCVAGLERDTGEWIRLVSDDEESHGALSAQDMRLKGGGFCQPLDVVKVEVERPVPTSLQPENVLIQQGCRWEKTGTFTVGEVVDLHPVEARIPLYGNLYPYVTEPVAKRLGYSLALVSVRDFTLHKIKNADQKEKTKASFFYHFQQYQDISVTDPNYYSKPDGFHLDRACLVVSLPDIPYHDRYYKFIAQIFPLE